MELAFELFLNTFQNIYHAIQLNDNFDRQIENKKR